MRDSVDATRGAEPALERTRESRPAVPADLPAIVEIYNEAIETVGVMLEVGRKFGRLLDVTLMQLVYGDWGGGPCAAGETSGTTGRNTDPESEGDPPPPPRCREDGGGRMGVNPIDESTGRRSWRGSRITLDVLHSVAGVATTIAVSAGEGIVLFDAGDGALRDLLPLPEDARSLRGVFITHGHYDHVGGRYAILGFQRMLGREAPFEVTAPAGCPEARAMIDAFRSCYPGTTALASARPPGVAPPGAGAERGRGGGRASLDLGSTSMSREDYRSLDKAPQGDHPRRSVSARAPDRRGPRRPGGASACG